MKKTAKLPASRSLHYTVVQFLGCMLDNYFSHQILLPHKTKTNQPKPPVKQARAKAHRHWQLHFSGQEHLFAGRQICHLSLISFYTNSCWMRKCEWVSSKLLSCRKINLKNIFNVDYWDIPLIKENISSVLTSTNVSAAVISHMLQEKYFILRICFP